MTRTLASIVVVGSLVATVVLGAADRATPTQNTTPQQQTPVFRAGVELVTLDVRVLDGSGRPVTGLTPDDFLVELEGKKQPARVVDYFEYGGSGTAADVTEPPPLPEPGRAAPRPGQQSGRSILLAVDDLSLKTQQTPAFIADAKRFIAKLGPNDSVGVATTGGQQALAPVSRDKTRASIALNGIVGRKSEAIQEGPSQRSSGPTADVEMGISNPEALAIQNGSDAIFGDVTQRICGRRSPLNNAIIGGPCAVAARVDALQLASTLEQNSGFQVDGLLQMMAILGESAPPRLLVVMSSGVDADATHAPWLSDLQSRAAATNVQVFVFMPGITSGSDAGDRSAMRSRLRRDNEEFGRRGLHLVANRLNADVHAIVGDFQNGLDRVLAGWSGGYRVGVDPPASRHTGLLPVKVSVKRPGISVRTAEYVMVRAPGASSTTASKAVETAPTLARSTEDTLARLVDGGGSANDVPIAIGATSKRDEAGHDVQVVTVEVPNSVHGPLSGLFAATDGSNQLIQRGTLSFPPPPAGEDHRISVVVPIAPGGYHLRVAVADATGAVGVVDHSGVARLSRLRSSTVSDLLLSWVGDDGRGRFVAMEAVPEPARTLQASIELYSTLDPAATVVRMALLKEGAAKPVAEALASPVKMPNGWRAGVSVPLASLEAGTYTVRATITEGTDPPLVISREVHKVAAARK